MASTIATSLGIGSGIDTTALVKSLADTVLAPKEALIKKREEANTAKISALGEAASAIDSFASALSSLISGGTLFSQPSVSDSTRLTATAKPGARLGDLSTEIEVEQLAQAQTLASASLTGADAAVGQGTLTLTTARGNFDIVIDPSNDSLTGLAAAINAANSGLLPSGVTASIVTEDGSARLVLKGSATGEANAFSLSVPSGTASGLERFAYGAGVTSGMEATRVAQDAIVKVDGVSVRRGSNNIGDLVDGMQIDLKKAELGAVVTLGVTRPTAGIRQAVSDFVEAFNELQGILTEATKAGVSGESGPLRGDLGIQDMQRQLQRLSTTALSAGDGPKTLAEIGVATNRDGTLRVDAIRLETALASDLAGVEALFNPGQRSSSPYVSIISAMGKAKPGTYTLSNIVPANGTTPASGKINGFPAQAVGNNLIASGDSGAVGLVIQVSGPLASGTITVDAGLGGALKAIRDALHARSGPLETSEKQLDDEADRIADDRGKMEDRDAAYRAQLTTRFTAMERQVSAYKATQTYLEQQIKIWTNSDN